MVQPKPANEPPLPYRTYRDEVVARVKLALEAETNPDWADTLQGLGIPAATLARLDDEIDLADAVLVPSAFVRRTFVESGVPAQKVLVSNLGAEPVADRPVRAVHDGPLRLPLPAVRVLPARTQWCSRSQPMSRRCPTGPIATKSWRG